MAMSTTYGPQIKVQTDRLKRTLEQYIRMTMYWHIDDFAVG